MRTLAFLIYLWIMEVQRAPPYSMTHMRCNGSENFPQVFSTKSLVLVSTTEVLGEEPESIINYATAAEAA